MSLAKKSFLGDLHTYVWRRLYANNFMVVIIKLNSVEFGGFPGGAESTAAGTQKAANVDPRAQRKRRGA